MTRTVFIASEGLQAPPRAGFHIHLLSLAQGLARHVRVRAVAWTADRGGEAWERWAASLPDGPSPDEFVLPIPGQGRRGSSVVRKLHYWKCVQKHLASEAQPGDVLWVRDLSTALFALPTLTRWLPGRRRLRHVYDASSLLELEAPIRGGGIRNRAMAMLEGMCRRDYDAVRTLGESMRQFLVERGVPASKVFVVPVGAHVPDRLPDPRTSLKKVLYIGSAMPWQGLDVLVEAMRRIQSSLPEVCLTIAGIHAADHPDIASEPNIDIVGWVEREGLGDLYASHDLFVIPRPSLELTRRVVPMKAVEAQAHGIPILSSRLEAIEEVTGGVSAYLVDPGSASALAEALGVLSAEPERLVRMSEAARVRAPQFDWRHITDDLATRLVRGECATGPL